MNARITFPPGYWETLVKGLLAAGYTQESLGEAVGAKQTTIADLCSGRTKEPRANLGFALKALADELASSEGAGK
jgi:transcriptional regulator with XRE-family HTH domain